jgi:hypothetical protein
MQGLLLVVVAASSAAESTPPVIPAIQFILVYGIAGSLIFGTLLNWLPEWFNRSPVEYGWYAITNVLMIAGAAFVVTGLYRGGTGCLQEQPVTCWHGWWRCAHCGGSLCGCMVQPEGSASYYWSASCWVLSG